MKPSNWKRILYINSIRDLYFAENSIWHSCFWNPCEIIFASEDGLREAEADPEFLQPAGGRPRVWPRADRRVRGAGAGHQPSTSQPRPQAGVLEISAGQRQPRQHGRQRSDGDTVILRLNTFFVQSRKHPAICWIMPAMDVFLPTLTPLKLWTKSLCAKSHPGSPPPPPRSPPPPLVTTSWGGQASAKCCHTEFATSRVSPRLQRCSMIPQVRV